MSGGIQVLGIEGRATLATPLIWHASGEQRPETARTGVLEGDPLGAVVTLADDVGAARRALKAARPMGRGRRPHEDTKLQSACPVTPTSVPAIREASMRAVIGLGGNE